MIDFHKEKLMSVPEVLPRPFVDFYAAHKISPVSQDISDISRHFRRRDSLYRFLGLPASFLRDCSVIEFGPGSGHNALFTASLSPARYVLVDANPKGLADTRKILEGHNVHKSCEIIESLFEEFDTTEQFDLVLAEGLLPFQRRPAKLLEHLSRFVVPGGVIVITTASPLSYLPEIARRLMRDVLGLLNASAQKQLEVLSPMLDKHLATLPGRSRPTDDWILDNVVQPFYGELFSIPEAIETLAKEFDLYGASPSFMTDLRWYKDVADVERGFNTSGITEYFRRAINMVDFRLDIPPHDSALGEELERIAAGVWRAMKAYELEGDEKALDDAIHGIQMIAERIACMAPGTTAALKEIVKQLGSRGGFDGMTHFPSLWGRGQQYLSFIRKL